MEKPQALNGRSALPAFFVKGVVQAPGQTGSKGATEAREPSI